MTFEQYCSVIENSARIHGYQMFLPSLYIPGDRPSLQVFDGLPTTGSHEQLAMEWSRAYMTEGQPMFVAYRGDPGIVHVCEFIDRQLGRSRRLSIERVSYGACG